MRAIFESAAIGAAILTSAAKFIRVNAAFCAMTGYSPEELRAMCCADLTHPDDLPQMGRLLDQLLAGETPQFVIEKRYIRKDGALIWVQNSVSLTRDAAGAPLHLVALCQDVTERKRAEEARRESDKRFGAIVAQVSAGIAETDLTGRFVHTNARYCEMLGYSHAELSRMRMHDITHPEDLPRNAAMFDELVRSGTSFVIEKRYVRKNGAIIWVSNSVSGVKDSNGQLANLVAASIDITERKEAEEKLRTQANHLEALNRIAKALSSDLDLERIVQTVTDSATELSGAKFGAFFYNVIDDQGERYLLYTLSGAPRAAFEKFGLTRNTAVFEHTFRGMGIVRSDDIRADPRYGRNPPHFGMPKGHLPVVSYLAVPVVSRTGEVHGGLFFGHDQAGMFSQEAEEIVAGIAAHAALAIDNARLLQTARSEIEQRKRAEEVLRQSEARLGAELAASRQLQHISTELISDHGIEDLYNRLVEAAAAIMNSEFASMQVLDPDRGELRLIAWHGFDAQAAATWEWVGCETPSSCAEALRAGRRVIVPDLATCDALLGTPGFDAYRAAGIQAMQSTPLLSRSGRLIGMISTHWRAPHEPTDRELRVFDVLSRQAADLIERAHAEQAARELNVTLEARVAERTRDLAEVNDRLRRERRLSELIVESTAEGIVVVDTELRHLVWNAGMERINGLPREAVLGRTVFEVFPHLTEHPTGQAWRDAIVGRRTEMRDRRYFSPTRGIEIVYDSDHTPLYDQAGAVIGAVCIVRETTERHRIEEMLRQSQKLEAIGQLTGGVAHDFNNLLTVVIGQAESIVMAAGDDQRIIRMATAVQRVAERGAQLTSQLLAFSRTQRLRPEAVVVGRLIIGIGDLVRRAVGEAVTLELAADPLLWPALVDPVQFEAAILNLAVNARDAMPAGGRFSMAVRNTVIGAAEAQRLDLAAGDYVLVSVSDTGCGMTPEVLSRCFEPFFTTKDVGKGTGLGLSQIYGFTRQSGGTTTIASAVGRGTTVSLYLPRTAAAPVGDSVPPAPPAAAVSDKTVLIVEDQEEVREVIEASLGELGYRTITASDGIAARKLLESEQPIDLLLTDIIMPNGVNGVALARWARQVRQDLKIVLISGYSRLDHSDGDVNGLPVLEKPFRQAELASTIAAALQDR